MSLHVFNQKQMFYLQGFFFVIREHDDTNLFAKDNRKRDI